MNKKTKHNGFPAKPQERKKQNGNFQTEAMTIFSLEAIVRMNLDYNKIRWCFYNHVLCTFQAKFPVIHCDAELPSNSTEATQFQASLCFRLQISVGSILDWITITPNIHHRGQESNPRVNLLLELCFTFDSLARLRYPNATTVNICHGFLHLLHTYTAVCWPALGRVGLSVCEVCICVCVRLV